MQNVPFTHVSAIKQAIDQYYNESPVAFLPSSVDFEEWLSTLLEDDQRLYRGMGMIHCGNIPSFKRYYFEKHGHKLEAFLKLQLSEETYWYWLSM